MIKKRDFILAGIIIAIGFISLICMKFFRKPGGYADIYVDGKRINRLPLSDDTTYTAETQTGTNVVIIENGEAYIRDADCPDKLCVHMGHISKKGDNIVCVPHKLVIEISGGEENEYDVR